jgi:hypothetical protein
MSATDKAKKPAPRIVFDIVEDGPPQAQLDTQGAIVWLECHDLDMPGTLLTEAEPDLVCEPLIGWQLQRMKKTEIATGRVEYYFDVIAIGATAEIPHWFAIEYPSGVIAYGDGSLQSAQDRVRLLEAKRRFLSQEK